MPVTIEPETTAAVGLTGVARYLADFEIFRSELPAEPAAVSGLRRRAIERFAALGFPTLQQEEWRQTNVSPIAQGTFARHTGAEPEVDLSRLDRLAAGAAAKLVFVNGRFSARLSSLEGLPAGVIV